MSAGYNVPDLEKKAILARYAELGSINAVAKEFGRSWGTVKAIIEADLAGERFFEQKREQNTRDMLEFMEQRRLRAQELVDLLLSGMAARDKIEKASLVQLATAFGIVVDKFARTTEGQSGSLQKLDALLTECKTATGGRDGV